MNWNRGLPRVFASATAIWFGVVFLYWPYRSTQDWIWIAESARARGDVNAAASAWAQAPIQHQIAVTLASPVAWAIALGLPILCYGAVWTVIKVCTWIVRGFRSGP